MPPPANAGYDIPAQEAKFIYPLKKAWMPGRRDPDNLIGELSPAQ